VVRCDGSLVNAPPPQGGRAQSQAVELSSSDAAGAVPASRILMTPRPPLTEIHIHSHALHLGISSWRLDPMTLPAAAAGEGAAEWGTAAGAAARGGAEQGGGGSSYSADVLGLAFGSLQKLGTVVHAAAAKVNRRLVTVIMEQYDFAEHCRALQSYLLLAQVIPPDHHS
jgi:hypothetical protein